MAQFDSLIVLPLLWSLIFILIVHYRFSMKFLIPAFCEIKKFKTKKLHAKKFFKPIKKNLTITSRQSYINTFFN